MSEPILTTTGLGRRFRRNWVLRNLDLRVPNGSVYGLLGRNGAGKTTLIRLLFGLLRANEGSVCVAGCTPYVDAVALRRAVAYAGDDLALYPHWRVRRVLSFATAMYEDWNGERAKRLISSFELPLDKRVSWLSTGLRARLVLLLALARDTKLLLLDEPFGAMDVVVRREVLDGVIDFLPGGDRTVFVTSHLVHELERLADHIGIIGDGKIAYSGSIEQLKSAVRRIRLGRSDSAPDRNACPWIKSLNRWGPGWEITVLEFREEYLLRLKSDGFRIESVDPLPLEDIAYEYLRNETEVAA